MEKFLIGVYTMVPPADVTNRHAADTGLDAAPNPPLTEEEFERVLFAAKQGLLGVLRDRANATRVAERCASSRKPRGALSDRAELMLGLVREETRFANGELEKIFIPRRDPVLSLYGRPLRSPGFRPSGASDVAILQSLVRRGLIREVDCSVEFAHAVTPEGIALYDEIKARRDALPAEPDEVDDGE